MRLGVYITNIRLNAYRNVSQNHSFFSYIGGCNVFAPHGKQGISGDTSRVMLCLVEGKYYVGLHFFAAIS